MIMNGKIMQRMVGYFGDIYSVFRTRSLHLFQLKADLRKAIELFNYETIVIAEVVLL